MKNKNLWLLAIVLALAALAIRTYRNSAKTSSGGASAQVFSVTDTAIVNKVVVTSRTTGRHLLERRPQNVWMLDSATEVSPAMAQQLLMTLHDVQVKRLCTRAERDRIIKMMATNNMKVEVWTAGEPARTFFLGDPTDESQGNYALLEGEEDPVVVNLASWQGYISARFDVDGVAWRTKHLFRSTPRTLQRVQVSFPATPSEDVDVRFEAGPTYKLAGVEHPDTSRLVQFLTSFSQIYIEEYIVNPRFADSLSKVMPLAIVTVRDLDPKKSHELRLFKPTYIPEGQKNPERVIGYIADQKQAVTLQTQNFVPLLTPKSAFMKPAS